MIDLLDFGIKVSLGLDEYVSSLLHMNGADASTTFTDETGKTWTASGNAQIDTAQYKFGGASGLFDGTGDYVTTPDHADFDVGSGEFTLDMWFRLNAVGAYRYLFGQMNSTPSAASRAVSLNVNSSNQLEGRVACGGSLYTASSATALSSGTWYHAALIREGNTLKIYLDGVVGGTTADLTGLTVNNSSNVPTIGRPGDYASQYFNGWIDEVRYSKGIARWTTGFTPPTTEY